MSPIFKAICPMDVFNSMDEKIFSKDKIYQFYDAIISDISSGEIIFAGGDTYDDFGKKRHVCVKSSLYTSYLPWKIVEEQLS